VDVIVCFGSHASLSLEQFGKPVVRTIPGVFDFMMTIQRARERQRRYRTGSAS
jgi:hypothetical protein